MQKDAVNRRSTARYAVSAEGRCNRTDQHDEAEEQVHRTMIRSPAAGCIMLVLALFVLWGFSPVAGGAEPLSKSYSAQPMPEYDAAFARSDGWTGGDAVTSVDMGKDKVLWLFSDSWIGPVVDGKHSNATMINNAIAIQRGRDVSKANISFHWGTDSQGKPSAFITPQDHVGWFWLFGGVRASDKLYITMIQTIKTEDDSVFGFKHVGLWLAEIENPNDDPDRWRIAQLRIPYAEFAKGGNTFFGSSLMLDGAYIYLYGVKEDWSKGPSGRSVIVARVLSDGITHLDTWQFYHEGQWQSDWTAASGLFNGAAPEYSVSYQGSLEKYVTIYTENGMSKDVLMRTSPTPAGPWSKAQKVYECPDADWHKTYFCYAAKGHLEISAPDELILTYVCNSTDFWQMAKDARIYRPRFVRIGFDWPSK